MEKIIKNCLCSLQVWIGPDEPILEKQNLYFSNKNEVKIYLNERLQEFKGETVECYVYQFYKGKPNEVLVSFEVK